MSRKAAYAVGILAVSYVVAAFANASPITQSPLPVPSGPVVVVVPADESEAVDSGARQADSPSNHTPQPFLAL